MKKGNYVVDQILDTAGQKGTGKWTVMVSADLGVPLTLIAEAVFARCLSSEKDARVKASKLLPGPPAHVFHGDKAKIISDIKEAVLCAKIISYAQGYVLMNSAAKEFGWKLNYGGVALMWRGGCIIRSKFLKNIKEAFDKNPNLDNLLIDDYFKNIIGKGQAGWRHACTLGITHGIPLPTITSALNYYDGYRTAYLPANLLQAQRDYFGAHTYERVDQPRGKFFHTNWTGRGGTTSSTTYNA